MEQEKVEKVNSRVTLLTEKQTLVIRNARCCAF